MIDNVNVYKKKMAWLDDIQDTYDNTNYREFNDHRHAIVASSDPYGLFAEVVLEGREYHYCNGELDIVFDNKGNAIWKMPW